MRSLKNPGVHAGSINKLTPTERQQILRKLKHGLAMDREALAKYAIKVREDVVKKREHAKA